MQEKQSLSFAENGHAKLVDWCLLSNGHGGHPSTSQTPIAKPIFGHSHFALTLGRPTRVSVSFRSHGIAYAKRCSARQGNGVTWHLSNAILSAHISHIFMSCPSLPRPWLEVTMLSLSRTSRINRALASWQLKNW
jgi:hypothetical protein